MKNLIYTILIVFTVVSLSSCATKVVRTKPAYKTVKVVKIAPKGHKVIHIKGQKYYKWNNKYYKKTKRGYVVVRL